MVVKVEVGLELLVRELRAHVLVRLEKRQEIAFSGPPSHGVALHEAISRLAGDAFLRKRDQYALRVNQPAQLVEVFLHRGRVDDQSVDDRGEPRERKIKRDSGV